MSYRILIVEDDVIIGEVLKGMLGVQGYEVAGVVRSASEIEQQVLDTEPDLVMLDINLQTKWDGIEAAKRILSIKHVPIVFLSGETEETVRAQIDSVPGAVLLGKPVVVGDLIETVRKQLGDEMASPGDNSI